MPPLPPLPHPPGCSSGGVSRMCPLLPCVGAVEPAPPGSGPSGRARAALNRGLGPTQQAPCHNHLLPGANPWSAWPRGRSEAPACVPGSLIVGLSSASRSPGNPRTLSVHQLGGRPVGSVATRSASLPGDVGSGERRRSLPPPPSPHLLSPRPLLPNGRGGGGTPGESH